MKIDYKFGARYVTNSVPKSKQMKSKSAIVKAEFPHIVIGALADVFERDPKTIIRWLIEKNDLLTSEKATKVFEDYGVEYDSKGLEKKLCKGF